MLGEGNHTKRFFTLICVFQTFLLCGCTDIRTRNYAELLAIRQEDKLTANAKNISEDTWISADADTVSLLPDALEAEGGEQLSFGHLRLLMLQGETLASAQEFLSEGWIAPNCPLLLLPPSENMKTVGDTEISEKLLSAVENGTLPSCSVGEIVGNLESRAGMAVLPYLQGEELRLALHDGERLLAVLSEEACRGAVLLNGRRKPMAFSENGADTIEMQKCRAEIKVSEQDDQLTISVSLHVRSEHPQAAEAAVRAARAFFAETVQKYGADTCFLEESARRNNITVPTKQAWRAMLRSARVEIAEIP